LVKRRFLATRQHHAAGARPPSGLAVVQADLGPDIEETFHLHVPPGNDRIEVPPIDGRVGLSRNP